MKREGQVRHKLKQVIFRHRKKFVEKGLSRRPENCAHNGVVRLPLHTGNRAKIRVCRFVKETGDWNNRVCDSSMAGDKQAVECPHFECKNTPESLKEEFSVKLGLNGEAIEPGVLAQEYPDVIALMWVLDTEKKSKKVEDSPKVDVLALFGTEAVAEIPENDNPLLEDTQSE